MPFIPKSDQTIFDTVATHMLTHYRASKSVQQLLILPEHYSSDFEDARLVDCYDHSKTKLEKKFREALGLSGVDLSDEATELLVMKLMRIRASDSVGMWHQDLCDEARRFELPCPVPDCLCKC